MATFILTSYADIPRVVKDSEYAKSKNLIVKKHQDLYIIKYVKSALVEDNIRTLGLFRSVVFDGKKILAFGPAKSVSLPSIIKNWKPSQLKLEEFVEGTMINCFYHNNQWKIATRGNIGAKCSFYQDNNKTFYDMFYEAISQMGWDINNLEKKYSYSFILQHPDNRIVVPFKKPHLVLAAVYECDGGTVKEQECHIGLKEIVGIVPKIYSDPNKYFGCWEDIHTYFCSPNTPYDIVGVMIKCPDGTRGKIRNPVYEKVRNLKGNSPKIQFQYYNLYQQGLIKEFLKYYPECKDLFWKYRNELMDWTEQLWVFYKTRYILKNRTDDDIGYAFRPHVWRLHEIYLNELRPANNRVTKKIVINYIYNLKPARIMYAINYPLRQRDKDDRKEEIPQY